MTKYDKDELLKRRGADMKEVDNHRTLKLVNGSHVNLNRTLPIVSAADKAGEIEDATQFPDPAGVR